MLNNRLTAEIPWKHPTPSGTCLILGALLASRFAVSLTSGHRVFQRLCGGKPDFPIFHHPGSNWNNKLRRR